LKRRFVATIEWLRLCPNDGPLRQTEQTFAMRRGSIEARSGGYGFVVPRTEATIDLPERYRVVRHVANGGMASVWAAEDGLLGRLVAVKVLAPHVAIDESSRIRFEREARTAARLSDHPNIVTIYDIGEHGTTAFIVMELYQGGTIADRLREGGPIPRPQALDWLEQAAAALDHAHGRDVVHRDVKPANLLLDERGRLGVGDFGIARLVDETSLTQAGQVLGTAAYLSPEQALGQSATAASDRYSLGVVAYELLTGRRPFQGEHAAAQARQHVEEAPPDAGLGRVVDEVLDRALAKDADDRYPTAERFVEELRHAVGRDAKPTQATRRATGFAAPMGAGAAATPAPPREQRIVREPASPPPPTPPRRLAPTTENAVGPPPGSDPSRRKPIGLALAGVAALALVVGLIALLAGGSGSDSDRASTPAKTQPAQQDEPSSGDEPTSGSSDEQPAEEEPTPAAPAAPEGDGGGQDNESEGGAGPSASGESPRALNDAGYAKLLAGDAQGAIPLLEQSVQGFDQQGSGADRTQFGYALYNLGQAYHAAGRYDEAAKMYERRLQVNPSDRPGLVRASLKRAKQQQPPSGVG
jgi:serine/threonine-protein kinase